MLLCSSSGAEALKLNVTDVKEWQHVWFAKELMAVVVGMQETPPEFIF